MNWLQRLYLAWMNREDRTAVMQTPVKKFEDFDQAKAEEGWRKAQAHTATGRPIPEPATLPSKVVGIRTRRTSP